MTPLDQRELHLRREKALWNTKLAGLAAWGSGALAIVIFALIGIDTGDWRAVAPFFLGAALTLGFGTGVYYGQSQLAAGVLLAVTVITAVLRVVQTGQLGGILWAGILVYCYFRGLSGAMELADLAKIEPGSIGDQAI
jgi:hypothetical protein